MARKYNIDGRLPLEQVEASELAPGDMITLADITLALVVAADAMRIGYDRYVLFTLVFDDRVDRWHAYGGSYVVRVCRCNPHQRVI